MPGIGAGTVPVQADTRIRLGIIMIIAQVWPVMAGSLGNAFQRKECGPRIRSPAKLKN
jgi:hypothetical protein